MWIGHMTVRGEDLLREVIKGRMEGNDHEVEEEWECLRNCMRRNGMAL